tara:strand:+ start:1313 stop:2161 length:849 start_codon:yes stop_codon:yes gene_type:complete
MFIDENSKPKEKLKAWYLFTEDFIAGTQHLTNQEIGIYIRLLCWNWNKRCKGIPFDEKLIFRIGMCFSHDEQQTCLKVLSENFRLINEKHWQNERQLQEFLYISKRIEASKENGKLGGRPKKPSQKPPTPTPTSTSKSSSKYSRLFSLFWENINNKVSKGTAEKNFLRIEQEWQDKPEELAKLYNSYYDSIKEKEYAKQPAFWLSAKKYLDKLPEKKYDFGVVNRDEERVKMFVDAIKDNKVTQFIKDYALRNKDIIDMGIRKGLITREQAINDLEMRNEYL